MLERTLNLVGLVAGIPALAMVFWEGYWVTGGLLALGHIALLYRYIQSTPATESGGLTAWLVPLFAAPYYLRLQLNRMLRARER
jgi:hypothetical protein